MKMAGFYSSLLIIPILVWLTPTPTAASRGIWKKLWLPDEHMPYFFTNNPAYKKLCEEDTRCPYKDQLSLNRCWGYEKSCPEENRMSMPECPGHHKGWIKPTPGDDQKILQRTQFWNEGDFGYISTKSAEMMTLCEPKHRDDSSLYCIKNMRYCVAKNIYMDFGKLALPNIKERYLETAFDPGMIGGHCNINRALLAENGEHKSPLQSWYAELQEYDSLPFKPIIDGECDLVLGKPTYLFKLDAGVNMYHHFCDFVNLYASQHLNNSFSSDVNIIMWDTSVMKYGDFFSETWKVFTDHPVVHLQEYRGKKVCIKNAIFPLLARMRRGLYYNMPLIPGCHSSSLIRAFSQHVLHRMGVTQAGPLKDKIRVTLLERQSKYRNILNQNELVDALKTIDEYDVRVVTYNTKHTSFKDQLQSTHNSDIFIGMHGAGLTHGLFLPDWGVLFEIHNCDDEKCYYDLARLRGVHYMTWTNSTAIEQEDEGHHPTLGAHKKFTNYSFDVPEFLRKVQEGAAHVRRHRMFRDARRVIYGKPTLTTNSKDEL